MAGIDKRSITMTVAGTERAGEASDFHIEADDTDSDFVTFADAAAGGGRDYTLHLTVKQDPVTGTLFDTFWTAPGTTVACRARPFGNATASATQPHYTFNVIVKEPNGTILGGEADSSATAYQTVELEWPLLAKPVKVTSGTG